MNIYVYVLCLVCTFHTIIFYYRASKESTLTPSLSIPLSLLLVLLLVYSITIPLFPLSIIIHFVSPPGIDFKMRKFSFWYTSEGKYMYSWCQQMWENQKICECLSLTDTIHSSFNSFPSLDSFNDSLILAHLNGEEILNLFFAPRTNSCLISFERFSWEKSHFSNSSDYSLILSKRNTPRQLSSVFIFSGHNSLDFLPSCSRCLKTMGTT